MMMLILTITTTVITTTTTITIATGGSVITAVGDYAYGAAILPDEDELKQNPVRYGRLADPDGYMIEVSEPDIMLAIKNPSSTQSRIKKIMLGVIDIDETVSYYNTLGLKEIRRRANINSLPKHASIVSWVSYSENEEDTFIELVYDYATETLDLGSGFKSLSLDIGAIDKDPNGYQIE